MSPVTTPPRVLPALKTVFSLDLRSIALFRVLLAVLVLCDLALRSQHLVDFYTDDGVLARSFWLQLNNARHWSLHAASGELWWQIVLFLLAVVFALGLLVGYQTRVMAFATFVLLASLINRNTLILHAGDSLLIVMSFWSMFLPLNARWSVDAALQPTLKEQANEHRFNACQPQLYFSMATIAVVVQILALYVFTAMLKTGDAWTLRFDAAFYAISLDQLATPIAIWARQFPAFFSLATVYVLVVEFVAPVLILLPFVWPWARVTGLALLVSLHLGFLLSLHIGLFPLIDLMALSLLLPSVLWTSVHRYQQNSTQYQRVSNLVIYYDEDCGFCLKMCLVLRELLLYPTVKIIRAQSNPSVYEIMEKHNSWVVKGSDNTTYLHWHAMQHLFVQRWPFKPLGWLMNFKPLMAMGNKIYRQVAENRGAMSRVTAWALPWQNISLKPTVAGSAVAGIFLIAVLVYNVSGLPGKHHLKPAVIDAVVKTARLDQRWDMFAPFPLTYSSYVQMPGKLRDGTAVNLYPTTGVDENWKPPAYLAPVNDGYRWRKYIERLHSHKNDSVRRSYGRYQCLQHNKGKTSPSPDQLATFEVWIVKLHTNTDDRARRKSRQRIWRHWCFAEFRSPTL